MNERSDSEAGFASAPATGTNGVPASGSAPLAASGSAPLAASGSAPLAASGSAPLAASDVGSAPAGAGGRQRAVEAFHRALGLTVAQVGSEPAIRDADLRVNLLREEAEEVIEALEAGALAALGGELSDLLYVTYGAAVTFGIGLADGEPRPAALPPAVRTPARLAERVQACVVPALAAISADDIAAAARALAAIPSVVEEVAAACGIRVGPFFDAVQAANMAKIGGPIRADGKRLKPDGWRPADLDAVLEAQRGLR